MFLASCVSMSVVEWPLLLVRTILLCLIFSVALGRDFQFLRQKLRTKRQLFPGLGGGGGGRNNGAAFGSCMAWVLEMLLNGFGTRRSPFQVPQPPALPDTSFPGNLLGPLVQETNRNNGVFGFQKKDVPTFSRNDLRQPVLRQQSVLPSRKTTIDVGNLGGLSPVGPQENVYIDTGKDFDRFLVHRLRGVDALGLPLFDKWKTQGAVWGDGDVEIVNSDGNGILGATISDHNKGFNIPIGTIFNAVNAIGKIGQKTKTSSQIR